MKTLGTREHYAEYVEECEEAGIMPGSWELFRVSYPNAPEHDTDATPAPVASEPTAEQELRALMDQPLSETENEMVRLIMQLDAENAQLEARNRELEAALKDIQMYLNQGLGRVLAIAAGATGDYSPEMVADHAAEDLNKAMDSFPSKLKD